jgi:hypothetical protein
MKPFVMRFVTVIALFSVTFALSTTVAQQRPRAPAPSVDDASIKNNARESSPVIYPARTGALRINHAHRGHGSLSCEQCHVLATRSQSPRDRLFPPEAACQPCHAAKLDRSLPTSENCGFCHRDFDSSRPALIPASIVPVARIHFSHQRHNAPGARCAECHADAAKTQAPIEKSFPNMENCKRCHKTNQGRGQCTTCHWSTPDGLLQTRFPEGDLKPHHAIAAMAHDSDWTVRHRWIGADQGAVCANCHRERDCTKCHDGSTRPSAIHPNDWLTLHPQQSRRNSPRCTSCHTAQTFCAECHAALGVSQLAAPNVRSSGRFHPPTSQWTRGANRHATEAKRSLTSCVSCHAERDCVRCHGAATRSGGISPHPRDFIKQCVRLLHANSRACKTCHGNIESILDRCD